MTQVLGCRKRWWLVARSPKSGKVVDVCFDQDYTRAKQTLDRVRKNPATEVLAFVYATFWTGFTSGTIHNKEEMNDDHST